MDITPKDAPFYVHRVSQIEPGILWLYTQERLMDDRYIPHMILEVDVTHKHYNLHCYRFQTDIIIGHQRIRPCNVLDTKMLMSPQLNFIVSDMIHADALDKFGLKYTYVEGPVESPFAKYAHK
jgi:hypothetical protein